jgi:NADH-quinone oxidoreductase subunit K
MKNRAVFEDIYDTYFSLLGKLHSGRAGGFFFYEDIWELLFIGYSLFFIGLLGILLSRTNFIRVLMCIELSLLGIGLQFISYSILLGDLHGQVVAVFLLAVAGAESAVGLAIFLAVYRLEGSIAFDRIENLRG